MRVEAGPDAPAASGPASAPAGARGRGGGAAGALRRLVRRRLPASLAGRTASVLLLALVLVQGAGLTIHALDRMDLQREAESRDLSFRMVAVWRALAQAPSERRPALLAEMELPDRLEARLSDQPAVRPGLRPVPAWRLELFRLGPPPAPVSPLGPVPNPSWRPPGPPAGGPSAGLPPRLRPREVLTALGEEGRDVMLADLRFAEGEWLTLRVAIPRPRPWHSDTFLVAFVLMTLAAAWLTVWTVARLTRPVRLLAAAAERLGRDVNAPPLPEDGPSEVAAAARAFNTMAARIRRFVDDRTQLLAAIGHDLRTPITRLRLRAEFLDDDGQRGRMLADLAEMEAMVAATLAFGRDDAAAEPQVALDLAALCRTVLDEAADATAGTPPLAYAGPDRLQVRARPVALKRALANLVGNALAYGGSAGIALGQEGGLVRLRVEDEGPGVPPEHLETVFQPFRRLEESRNRETGGTGLGLTIARNILRAHGGDVVLRNRPGGGLCAEATLPA